MSSIRESLEAAATSAETATETTTTEAPAPAETSPTPVPETSGTSESGQARGPDGKFAKAEASQTPKPKNGATGPEKPSTEAPSASVTTATAATATPPPAAPKYKAPSSWKLALRDRFGTLAPELQEEIDRTHRANEEGVRALKAQADKAEFWQKAYEPYAGQLGDPRSVLPQALQLISSLRTGSPQQRAHAIANLYREAGITVESLAAAIDGGPQAQPQQQITQQDIERMARDAYSKMAEQGQREAAASELERFASGKEFFDDVRGEMSVIIRAAAQRGQPVTLEQAYERACQIHPEVSEYVSQRKAKEAAAAAAQKAAAEKAAAVSVKTDPAGGGQAAKPKSIRAMLEAAAEASGA